MGCTGAGSLICRKSRPSPSGRFTSRRIRFIFRSRRFSASSRDMLQGFRAGCDDYVTKPFSMPVLVMKIKALLKRSEGTSRQIYCSGQNRSHHRTEYYGKDSKKHKRLHKSRKRKSCKTRISGSLIIRAAWSLLKIRKPLSFSACFSRQL